MAPGNDAAIRRTVAALQARNIHVIVVVGIQKIVPTFEAAMQRVRGHTLVKHDQWLAEMGRAPTPIGKLGIIEYESQAGRMTVILVKELLGW